MKGGGSSDLSSKGRGRRQQATILIAASAGSGMVSGTPAQAKYSSTSNSMWGVVVLGIITAVFAWVWFGGRGSEKTRSEAQHRPATAEIGAKDSAKSHTDDSERKESSVAAQTSQEDNVGDPETQEGSPGNSHAPDNGAGHTAGEERLLNSNELNPVESLTREGKDDHLSKESHKMEEQLTPVDPKTLEMEDLMMDSTEDVYYFTVPENEVVQISQDILQSVAKEAFEPTQVADNHSIGLEKQGVQVNEDLSTSVGEDKELGAKEEVYPSVGQSRGKVTVEDLKPFATEEKVEQTIEEKNHFIVAAKVVPIRAETVPDLTHPLQDGNVKQVNGGEENFQKEKATVSPEGNVTKGNALNVTVSPKQVSRSSAEDTLDQYDHNKLESCEQSETNCVNEKPSATLESAADVQVTGHIVQTNNLSEVSIPSKLEEVDKSAVLLHSSNQKEESPDFKRPGSGDGSCLSTLSEAKLIDLDSQRTKRVAAVQPIPQNVSLAFKVHYIALSGSQMIAVTGDHEKLGEWENYVPLTSDKDGYWSHSVALPADANIEWKFVMVENGKIKRWEECNNRHVRTAHEDIATQQWWGYP